MNTILQRYNYLINRRQAAIKEATKRGLIAEADAEKYALHDLLTNDFYLDEIRKENLELAAKLC